jgi:hypothetical protein
MVIGLFQKLTKTTKRLARGLCSWPTTTSSSTSLADLSGLMTGTLLNTDDFPRAPHFYVTFAMSTENHGRGLADATTKQKLTPKYFIERVLSENGEA